MGNGRPVADMRAVMEGIVWRYRTGVNDGGSLMEPSLCTLQVRECAFLMRNLDAKAAPDAAMTEAVSSLSYLLKPSFV
jgi:hypothetical protein